MRTNIDIDDTLMAEAQKASGQTTKKQTVEQALRDVDLSVDAGAMVAVMGPIVLPHGKSVRFTKFCTGTSAARHKSWKTAATRARHARVGVRRPVAGRVAAL